MARSGIVRSRTSKKLQKNAPKAFSVARKGVHRRAHGGEASTKRARPARRSDVGHLVHDGPGNVSDVAEERSHFFDPPRRCVLREADIGRAAEPAQSFGAFFLLSFLL